MTRWLIFVMTAAISASVGGGLGHAPPGTRRTKPPPLAAEGQQHLMLAGITAQPQKAMGQDTAR